VGCNGISILSRLTANLTDSSTALLPSSLIWLGIQLRVMFLFCNSSVCNWCNMFVMRIVLFGVLHCL